MLSALWLAIYLGALAWSGLSPHDRFIWWLEVTPAILALPALALTRRRFPLTPLSYVLILGYAIVVMVGGKYTFQDVPLFDRIQEAFGLSRNYFDKASHLVQGFVPAILLREYFVRRRVVAGPRALAAIVVLLCLSFSALYELVEWWIYVGTGPAAEAFLGTQGDPWDAQSDMLCALLGATASIALLSRLHDRQIARLAT